VSVSDIKVEPGAERLPRLLIAGALAVACIVGMPLARAEGTAESNSGAGPTPAAVSTLPSSLPVRRDAAPIWETGGIGVLGALGVVLLAAGAAAWVLRRTGNSPRPVRKAAPFGRWFSTLGSALSKGPQDDLRLVRTLRLTPRASVHVIEWDGRQWLIGAAENAVSVLGDRVSEGATEDFATTDRQTHRSAS
jgi:flagellar biogenesis protein FliO